MKKYSITFLILIIVIKLIYLYFESHYNGSLIDISSDPNVEKEILNNLELYGHKLSAIGLTLLLIPLFYLGLKKYFSEFKTFIFLGIFSIILYSFFYISLNKLIEKIIEDNKDKRYSAYYTTIFKYGMLNNKMGYNSFIPNERLENFSIEDKVLISNMFLLTFFDSELISRIVKNGTKLTEAYISKYDFDNYKKSELQFNDKVKEINALYAEYISKNKEINENFSKEDNAFKVNTLYEQFKIDLNSKYIEYYSKSNEFEKNKNPSEQKIDKYYEELNRYFRYQNISSAKDSYRTKMINEFGYYIEPSRWCDGSICPSKISIVSVIKEENKRQWLNKIGNIEPHLNKESFFKHSETRKKVALELRKEGLNVPLDFNYSRDSFIEAYKNKLQQKHQSVTVEFKNKFKKRLNKDIVVGLNYAQFVSYWKNELLTDYGQKYGNILFSMIQNKNTEEYYSKFYVPYYEEKYLKNYILEEKQFEEDEHKQKGDDAIKSLFVIPFAIGMSLLSGLLNLLSVLVLISVVVLRFVVSDNKSFIIINFMKIVFYIGIIYYPYKIGKENNILEPYKVLRENNESDFIKYYTEALNWILTCEKFNYKYIYEPYLK